MSYMLLILEDPAQRGSRTREEALAIARTCPAAEWATVEVRETAPCYL